MPFRRFVPAALLLLPLAAQPATLTLSAERLQHGEQALEDVRMTAELSGTDSLAAQIQLAAARATVAGLETGAWQLACTKMTLSAHGARCENGALHIDGFAPIALHGQWQADGKHGALKLHQGEGLLQASVQPDGSAELTFAKLPLAALAVKLPALQAYSPEAMASGTLRWQAQGQLAAQVEIRDGRFGTADGLFAGDKLHLALQLDATRKKEGWTGSAELDWHAGEAFFNPLYITAEHLPHVSMQATLSADGKELHITRLAPTVADMEGIEADGLLALSPTQVRRARVRFANANLARIGARWLAPVLFPDDPQKAMFTGHAEGEIALDDGRLDALDVRVKHASLNVPSRPLRLGPMDGEIPWRRSDAGRFHLNIAGGQWHKLTLGAFALEGHFNGPEIHFSPIRMPVVDGALRLDDFVLHHVANEGWYGKGSARIETMTMEALSEALDLPKMHGVLAAELPGLLMRPGEIRLDGQLTIGVFDGILAARDLRILEPFGSTSRLTTNIHAHRIDLYQLTRAFAFGNMQGLIDGTVDNLILHRWRPISFRARITNSEGSHPRLISQRAVENLTEMAGGMASLQRAALRVFQNFNYRRLGVGCVLEDGVCTLSGIEDDGKGDRMVFVEGSGIPALSIVGYNRRIDWSEFVSRLQAVIESNRAPVVE
ncbi:MAG: hypothetical protein IK051_07130 [Rhodocyclaceae bacterium]|nr:hypothetical protein [Rhodocyclaceae bacterium]